MPYRAATSLRIAFASAIAVRFSGSKRVIYDRVDLLGPADEARLLADLSERTGLNVERVDVRRIDFLHDTADLTIYYEDVYKRQI